MHATIDETAQNAQPEQQRQRSNSRTTAAAAEEEDRERVGLECNWVCVNVRVIMSWL